MTTIKFRTVSHGISGVPDSAVIIANLGNYTTYVAVKSLERLTGWSASRILRAVPNHLNFMVPAVANGTRQAREMAFVSAIDFARKAYEKINYELCSWLAWLDDGKNLTAPAAPVAPVSIDFDATGGIEELNRVVSSLDVPYQVRARALSIQNDFSQLAKIIDTLNTTGKAE